MQNHGPDSCLKVEKKLVSDQTSAPKHKITVLFPQPGGPFDLMSRRLIVASSRKIAERIAKEIKQFDVGRDDAGGL